MQYSPPMWVHLHSIHKLVEEVCASFLLTNVDDVYVETAALKNWMQFFGDRGRRQENAGRLKLCFFDEPII